MYHPEGRKTQSALGGYSFAQAPRNNDTLEKKQSLLPNPQSYINKNEMKNQRYLAKSMLGGSIEPKVQTDNGVPGPGAYKQVQLNPIKGFVIVPATNAAKRDASDVEKM